MENAVQGTETEPESCSAIKPSYFLTPFLLLLFLVSCKEKSKQKPAPVVNTDSIAKARQQIVADSLVKVSSGKKKIYITFDDSPNKGTRNVLASIKKEKVPVSFFVVGKHAFDSREQKETWEMLKADSAIELCNHSYTHALNRYTKFYSQPDSVIADFQKAEQRLELDNKIARMPGRNAWRIDTVDHTDIRESIPAIDSLHKAGFAIMGWDVEWHFDHNTFAVAADTALLLRQIENMLEAGKTRTKDHLVLLAHDQAFQKEEDIIKLEYVLHQLKSNPKYELKLANDYPGIGKYVSKN
jgi:peptidoglycan/xylan/chitin deacetylase (PgdA/CDA1 family)